MIHGNKTELHHEVQKDEKAVSAVVDLIQGWINQFSEKQELVCIASAKVAPKDMTSDLMKAFEIGQQSYATFENENCASVVDGMGLVQRVKGDQATFGDIATTVLSMALNEGGKSNRIDVVFDMYSENSTKNSEKLIRGEESGHQLQAITGRQIVRQWRSLLTRVKNKNMQPHYFHSQRIDES